MASLLRNKRHDSRVVCTVRICLMALFMTSLALGGIWGRDTCKTLFLKVQNLARQKAIQNVPTLLNAFLARKDSLVKTTMLFENNRADSFDSTLAEAQKTYYQLQTFLKWELKQNEDEIRRLIAERDVTEAQEVVDGVQDALSDVKNEISALRKEMKGIDKEFEKYKALDSNSLMNEIKAKGNECDTSYNELYEMLRDNRLSLKRYRQLSKSLENITSFEQNVIKRAEYVKNVNQRMNVMDANRIAKLKAYYSARDALAKLPVDQKIVLEKMADCKSKYNSLSQQVASLAVVNARKKESVVSAPFVQTLDKAFSQMKADASIQGSRKTLKQIRDNLQELNENQTNYNALLEQHKKTYEALLMRTSMLKGNLERAGGVGRDMNEKNQILDKLAAELPSLESELANLKEAEERLSQLQVSIEEKRKKHENDKKSLLDSLDAICRKCVINRQYNSAIELYQLLASSGNVDAMTQIGMIYEDELEDLSNAKNWYLRAASRGAIEASYRLGKILFDDGKYYDAVKWIRIAAEKEHPKAMSLYGIMLSEDKRISTNAIVALGWWKKAAANGDLTGMRLYGNALIEGVGTSKNPEAGYQWVLKAAVKGDAKAQEKISLCHLLGIGTTKDLNAAERWARLSAGQNETVGLFRLGCVLEQKKRYSEALVWYTKAAEQGHAGAMNNLGVLYHKGANGNSDYYSARKYFSMAADAGDTWGQINYALYLINGWGGKEDFSEAEKYLNLAANNPDIDFEQKKQIDEHFKVLKEKKGSIWTAPFRILKKTSDTLGIRL